MKVKREDRNLFLIMLRDFFNSKRVRTVCRNAFDIISQTPSFFKTDWAILLPIDRILNEIL